MKTGEIKMSNSSSKNSALRLSPSALKCSSALRLSPSALKTGWQMIKFAEIAKEVNVTTKDPLKDGLEFYVGLEHLDSQSLRIQRKGVIADDNPTFNKRFSPGHILFGRRRAYLKKAAVADFEGICSGDITVIEAIPGKIIPELLPFIVQSDMFFDWAIKNSAGGLSPRVKWKSLAEFEFPLPPLDRQKNILEVLQKVDYCINLTNQAIEQTVLFYKSTRFEMINYGAKKNRFKIIPENWDRQNFIEFATLQRGFDLPEQDRKNGGYPIFASANIVGTHCDYMCEAPGVITGRSGTIGQVAYAEEKFWPLNTALFVKDFHGNLPKFVKYFIELFHVERFATGTGVPTLNRNIVHKEIIYIPPINEQSTIVNILNKMNQVIEIYHLHKQNHLALRNKIFKTYFGGTK